MEVFAYDDASSTAGANASHALVAGSAGALSVRDFLRVASVPRIKMRHGEYCTVFEEIMRSSPQSIPCEERTNRMWWIDWINWNKKMSDVVKIEGIIGT
jgi:hypothetical protein